MTRTETNPYTISDADGTRELIATSWDGWSVEDPAGGVWHATGLGNHVIDASDTPEATACALAASGKVAYGTWKC